MSYEKLSIYHMKLLQIRNKQIRVAKLAEEAIRESDNLIAAIANQLELSVGKALGGVIETKTTRGRDE